MERDRIISWIIAAIVMLSIMLIGKGCMGEPDTSGLKKNKKHKDNPVNINIQTGVAQTEPPEYDIFGKPVTTVTTMTTVAATTTEETAVETDIFGQPVTTAAETDIFGQPVTTDIAETTMQPIENISTETTTLSLLEQYQESLNDPNSIGGFNHNRNDTNGNPMVTLPPDFAIVIN